MANQQCLTSTHRKIFNTIQECLEEMRAADLDDGKTYFYSAMNVISECLSTAERYQIEMTLDSAVYLLTSGKTALNICGERLLHLSQLPAPTNVAARVSFQPSHIHKVTEAELCDPQGEGHKAHCRAAARANLDNLFAQPTRSDFNQWHLTRAGAVLMLCGEC